MGEEASNVEKVAKFLKIIADTNRLKIISVIGKKECSVSELINETGLPQTLVSFHLKVLREAEIVEAERKGAFIYYRLKNSSLLDLLSACEAYTSDVDTETEHPRVFCPCPPWFNKRNK